MWVITNVSKIKILRAPISCLEWKTGLFQLPHPHPQSSTQLVLNRYLLNIWCGMCHPKKFPTLVVHFKRDKDDL